ncbi:MAG: putative 4-hydroxybenzoate polyprenyltransferase [Peptococcaceae bacterium]|nr:putative 4-hydroxybenzoate polyprenyltransferase [Peptococcaceae bacterium]
MVFRKLVIFLEMIRFEHTVFALPFAYMGALLVDKRIPDLPDIIWITVAMVGARTAAMSLNRLIDRYHDARNPRTAERALPKGLLKTQEVWLYVIISLLVLMFAAYQLTPLAFQLAPLAVLALVSYSYTKRFTWTCHLVLGMVLAIAPVGSWIAITGQFALTPVVLGAGVLFWVAGFDIIYACADYDFDRRERLHSIPVRFGIKKALQVSTAFHLIAPACFLAVALLAGLGWLYMTGLGIAVIILFYQHTLVKPDDLSRAGTGFFNLNGILSLVMFVFTLSEVLILG